MTRATFSSGSSARETAARVAAGGIAKALLAELGVEVYSYVRRIGSVELPKDVFVERAHRGLGVPLP